MGNVGLINSVTIGANEHGLTTYQDAPYQGLLSTHCANVACTVLAKRTGVDDFPPLSYYDITLRSLKVMHCENQFCTPFFRRR
mgnify:CR=1 FL=1